MIDQNLSPLSDLLLERAASVRGESRPFAEPPEPSALLEAARNASMTAQPPLSPTAC